MIIAIWQNSQRTIEIIQSDLAKGAQGDQIWTTYENVLQSVQLYAELVSFLLAAKYRISCVAHFET